MLVQRHARTREATSRGFEFGGLPFGVALCGRNGSADRGGSRLCVRKERPASNVGGVLRCKLQKTRSSPGAESRRWRAGGRAAQRDARMEFKQVRANATKPQEASAADQRPLPLDQRPRFPRFARVDERVGRSDEVKPMQ